MVHPREHKQCDLPSTSDNKTEIQWTALKIKCHLKLTTLKGHHNTYTRTPTKLHQFLISSFSVIRTDKTDNNALVCHSAGMQESNENNGVINDGHNDMFHTHAENWLSSISYCMLLFVWIVTTTSHTRCGQDHHSHWHKILNWPKNCLWADILNRKIFSAIYDPSVCIIIAPLHQSWPNQYIMSHFSDWVSGSIRNRSFLRRVFPGNWLHRYWQSSNNKEEIHKMRKTNPNTNKLAPAKTQKYTLKRWT